MKILQIALILAGLANSRQLLLAGSPSGQVVGWGANLAGEATGVPKGTPPNTPNTSTGVVTTAGLILSNADAVAAGMGHSLALRSDGTVVGWGNNESGEAVGYETPYPNRANGQVKIGGQFLSNIVAIAAGRTHSLALKRGGAVVAWGENQFGQTSVPATLTNAVAIAAGGYHSLGLKQDGTLVSWGEGNAPPPGLSNVVAIAAGRVYYGDDLALKSDGTVVEWALRGIEHEVPVPPGLSNVVAISSGWNHRLALKKDGTVVGWGDNNRGQATGAPTQRGSGVSGGPVAIAGQILSNITAIAAGHEFSLALKRDGTVVAWGYNGFHQTDVPAGLSNVAAVAAGENFCLALTTNGAPWMQGKR